MNFGVVYKGTGNAVMSGDSWVLASDVATTENESHSVLVLSDEDWKDTNLFVEVKTIEHLRQNGYPKPWEVASVVFGAKEDWYYYAMLCPEGLEVGIMDKDNMLFVDRTDDPILKINYPHVFRFNFREQAFDIQVDNFHKITIPRRIPTGKVGFYVEDCVGEFRLL